MSSSSQWHVKGSPPRRVALEIDVTGPESILFVTGPESILFVTGPESILFVTGPESILFVTGPESILFVTGPESILFVTGPESILFVTGPESILFVTGPESILFVTDRKTYCLLQDRKVYCLQARPCIFQPGNCTGWGSEGVNGTRLGHFGPTRRIGYNWWQIQTIVQAGKQRDTVRIRFGSPFSSKVVLSHCPSQ